MQIDNTKLFDLLVGVIFILLGSDFVFRSKKNAQQAIKWNSKLWGFAGKEKHYRIAFSLGGAVFVIFGLLRLFDII